MKAVNAVVVAPTEPNAPRPSIYAGRWAAMFDHAKETPLNKHQPFRLSIGAAPTSEPTLSAELQLLKVGLLYADHTTLCSPRVSFFAYMKGALSDLAPFEKGQLLVHMSPATNLPEAEIAQAVEALTEFSKLRKLVSPTRRQRERLKALSQIFDMAFEQMEAKIAEFLDTSGADSIRGILSSDLVTLHPLDATRSVDELVVQFISHVHRMASDGDSYPLFDDLSGAILSASTREGSLALSQIQLARTRSAPIAATLFSRLPLFEPATLAEILDIRRELERPLVRFRAAMITFADKVNSAPWEEDFPKEVETLIRKDIDPVILDIEDQVRTTPYLASLLVRAGDKPLAFAAGSGLGLVLANASALPGLAAQALGLAVSAAYTLLNAHLEWLKERQTIESNQLYFYYRVRRNLSS